MAPQLKPWYEIATPHEDIREGRLDEAVFAADLWAAVQDEGPEVYRDPEEFYRKTFMTAGLVGLINRVSVALSGGDAGDRIVGLQTSFGGGKTHTLLALWHLAKHSEVLRSSSAGESLRLLLDSDFPADDCSVAVFTNQTCDVTQGRETPEGVTTRTLWGELALQLGGPDLYELVRANDDARACPQGIFADVLRRASPCLILIDELADYCVGGAAVTVGDSTLADQTIAFVQQLTAAVSQVPGAVVVATLPASKFEVAQSERGQEILTVLESRFQRVGADTRLVADDEIYEVVRARLFESIEPESGGDGAAVAAEAFQNMYKAHASELPKDATHKDYRDRIVRSFPFHPLVIDALYTRWGSHPQFQRTRGVLRLLASVIADLWDRRNTNTVSQPLIMPCHIGWSVDAMQAALTRFWGDQYQSVAAADVHSGTSNARSVDEEKGGDHSREQIAQGIAASILLGSFGGSAERAGFNTADLHLAFCRPGLNWNYVGGALLDLESRCFYLHTAIVGRLGKRYWFSTKVTLNRLIVQYRNVFADRSFHDEIIDELRAATRAESLGEATWRVLVDPGVELPEQRSLTLVIMPPNVAWSDDKPDQAEVMNYVLNLSQRCGNRDRLYRNTVLFLAASKRGVRRLQTAHQEHSALLAVRSEYGEQLDDQLEDLDDRIAATERAVTESLCAAYSVALRVGGQQAEEIVLPDARSNFVDHLRFLWETLVLDQEWILTRVGPLALERAGVIPESGGTRLRDAVDAFLRFTDKPMVSSQKAVTDGIELACSQGRLGIARGPNLSNPQTKFCGDDIALDPADDGTWIIPPFRPDPSVPDGDDIDPGNDSQPSPASREYADQTVRSIARPVSGVVVSGSVPLESWSDLFRSFINPSSKMNLKSLKLGIRFELEASKGNPLDADGKQLGAMKESANQLGLSIELREGTSKNDSASEAGGDGEGLGVDGVDGLD